MYVFKVGKVQPVILKYMNVIVLARSVMAKNRMIAMHAMMGSRLQMDTVFHVMRTVQLVLACQALIALLVQKHDQ